MLLIKEELHNICLDCMDRYIKEEVNYHLSRSTIWGLKRFHVRTVEFLCNLMSSRILPTSLLSISIVFSSGTSRYKKVRCLSGVPTPNVQLLWAPTPIKRQVSVRNAQHRYATNAVDRHILGLAATVPLRKRSNHGKTLLIFKNARNAKDLLRR